MSIVYRKECCKCGCKTADVHYDSVLDCLQFKCQRCGYQWTEKPLDAKKEQSQ